MYVGYSKEHEALRDELRAYYDQLLTPEVEDSLRGSEGAGEAPRASNKRLYADLYATLRQGAPLAITPQSIRRQIAVLEQCRALSPV